jgi:hypothetical protein
MIVHVLLNTKDIRTLLSNVFLLYMRLSGNCWVLWYRANDGRKDQTPFLNVIIVKTDDQVALDSNRHLLFNASFFDTLPFQETGGNNCCRRQTSSDAV